MNSRYEKAIEKYSPQLKTPVIDQLAYSDPSGDHKYLDWMCSKLIQRCELADKESIYLSAGLQSVTEMTDTVISFHSQLSKFTKKNFDTFIKGSWYTLGDHDKVEKAPTDIYSYSTYHVLEYYVKSISKIMTRKDHSDIVHKETSIIFEDETWKVLIPLTMRSSNYYGRGTKWCTSATENNQYESYDQKGNLIYVIGPDKLAFYHSWDENEYTWYDDLDNRVSQNTIREILPTYIIKEVYKSDEYDFSEYVPRVGQRGYLLKAMRDFNFSNPKYNIDGWEMDFDDNAGVWKLKDDALDFHKDIHFWINPTAVREDEFEWMGVLSDEYFKRTLTQDELYCLSDLEEADELYDRLFVPIRIPLVGGYDADKDIILKDYFMVVRYFIGKVKPMLDKYLEDIVAARSYKLGEINKAHGVANGDIFTPTN